MGEKRRRVFRRRFSDLRIKMFRNLFDGEQHRKARAENVVAEDDFKGGDFKAKAASRNAKVLVAASAATLSIRHIGDTIATGILRRSGALSAQHTRAK